MEDVKVPSFEGLSLAEPVLPPAPPTPEEKEKNVMEALEQRSAKLEHPKQLTPEQAEKELIDAGLEDHRLNRKALCEKLEKDPEFRQKYIEQQKLRAEIAKMQAWREHRKQEQEQEQAQEQEPLIPAGVPDSEPLPDPEPTGKTGVYIANVQKLVINITL